ncbi:hypothetical protein J2X65_004258 [Ancylobacter sp. 3268]|uniref:hypothetical protein n=1 Tax=Ancylobacter sp. 3268 TaxID=2817752 RepID=UPI002855066D|nr:hypothetical protein [Ancylobacter sp. 3268]MDR6954882.1 hypothetical protein [Ancylobacter sp. 3268]
MKRSALVEPILIAEVNETPVRFFAPPDGRPSFAWAAIADVALAARYPEPRNPSFLVDLLRDAGDDAARINTPDGSESVVAFWLAKAFFDGAVLIGAIEQSVGRAFVREAAIATSTLIDPRRAPLERYLVQARIRHDTSMTRFMP